MTEPRTEAGKRLLDWFGGPMRRGEKHNLSSAIAAIEVAAAASVRAAVAREVEALPQPGYGEGWTPPLEFRAAVLRILDAATEPQASDSPESKDGHGDGSDCTNACHDERCIRVHGHFPGSDHSDGVNNWPLPQASDSPEKTT